MKKLVLFFAAAAMAVSASAQVTVEGSKLTDNIYVSVSGGVGTYTTHNKWLKNLMPNVNLRIGKNITPIFGIAVEGDAYFGLRSNGSGSLNSTAVKALNTSLLGTVNFNNLFCGYKGEPRAFEVTGIFGLGWWHTFGSKKGARLWDTAINGIDIDDYAGYVRQVEFASYHQNKISSKVALNLAYNFGSQKQWQVFVEPALTYTFGNNPKYIAATRNASFETLIDGEGVTIDGWDPTYNINNSIFQVNAGIVYKFKNSNGTHNFKIAQLRDQAEIDELNRIINELRNRKPEVITKEVIKEVPVGKEVRVEDLVFVTFAQGKYNLTNDAKAALDKVKEGAHVQIVGTASPEGSKELNDRLSQNRANAVADYLKGRGVVVDEAIGKGVQGTTSNRLAIVYVK
jgi:outer membrane protein OmpA-like peptidoglycan-associated protein